MKQHTILIIEDDDLQYEIYEETLAAYRLIRAKNGSEALAQIPRVRPDLSSSTMFCLKANSVSISFPSSRNCCRLFRLSLFRAHWKCINNLKRSRGRAALIIA